MGIFGLVSLKLTAKFAPENRGPPGSQEIPNLETSPFLGATCMLVYQRVVALWMRTPPVFFFK